MKINPYSLFKGLLLTCAAIFMNSNVDAQYCAVAFANGCGPANCSIQSVSTTGGINNITNNNTYCGNSSTSYSDYTSMKVTQEALKSVNVRVRLASNTSVSSSIVRIYVDWNRDQDFSDAGEYIAPAATTDHVHTSPGSNVTVKITVPGFAKEGLTRMRIVLGSAGPIYDPGTQACALNVNANHGECEDYTFEVINPCLPPNVISIANLDYKSADISWTPKLNAEMYEYLIKRDGTLPPTGTNGYSYTTTNSIEVDTFACDTKYYIFVRLVCDSAGIAPTWKISDWARDSFVTPPCCYIPKLTVKNIASTTTLVSWDPIQSAYGYEYAVSTTTKPPQQGTYTTSTSVLLQGLEPKTTHFVHVRSRCNPTPLSDWGKEGFKTTKYLTVNSLYGTGVFTMDAYPSPMSDRLNVVLNGDRAANAQVTILDLTGKVVYNAPVNTDKVIVNVSNLTSGIYVVKYTDDIHNEIMKVTKK